MANPSMKPKVIVMQNIIKFKHCDFYSFIQKSYIVITSQITKLFSNFVCTFVYVLIISIFVPFTPITLNFIIIIIINNSNKQYVQTEDEVGCSYTIFLLVYISLTDKMYTSVIHCHKTTLSGECVYLMGSGHFTDTVMRGVIFYVTFCETTKLSFVSDDRRAFVKG